MTAADITDAVRRSPDDSERPADADGEWYSVENDLVLVPDETAGPERTS